MYFASIVSFITALYAIGLTLYLLARVLLKDRISGLAMLNNFTPWFFLPLIIFLPLALLLHDRWLIALALILTAVALVWFGPYYLPRRTNKSADSLHVLTFNMWGSNPCKPEIAGLLREINADLVFLQEVSAGYVREELPRLKDIYPYQFAPITEQEWWNNATLSHYPIVESQDLLTWDNGTPALHKITINVNGHSLVAYNAHLCVPFKRRRVHGFIGGLGRVLRYDDAERNRLIVKLLDILKAEQNPYVLAGDFNMSCYSAPYSELRKLMVDSYRETGRGFGLTWPVSPADNQFHISLPMLRIDYIWHSPNLTATSAYLHAPFGSDHLPLHAIISFDK